MPVKPAAATDRVPEFASLVVFSVTKGTSLWNYIQSDTFVATVVILNLEIKNAAWNP